MSIYKDYLLYLYFLNYNFFVVISRWKIASHRCRRPHPTKWGVQSNILKDRSKIRRMSKNLGKTRRPTSSNSCARKSNRRMKMMSFRVILKVLKSSHNQERILIRKIRMTFPLKACFRKNLSKKSCLFSIKWWREKSSRKKISKWFKRLTKRWGSFRILNSVIRKRKV